MPKPDNKATAGRLSGIFRAARGEEEENQQSGREAGEEKPQPKEKTPKSTNPKTPKSTNTETPNKGSQTRQPAESASRASARRRDEKLVHITIEAPESLRKFWKSRAALTRSFKDVAHEAFTKEYGLPPEENE